jgi:hypothetical protein
MEPALACILAEKGVPLDIQDLFITEGVSSVSIFAHLASSPAELMQILKDNFGLNPEHSLFSVEAKKTQQSNQAKVLDAWCAATIKVAEEAVRLILHEHSALGVELARAREDLQLKERYFAALSSLNHFSASNISPSSQSTTASPGDTPPQWKKVWKLSTMKVPQAKGQSKGKPRSKGKNKLGAPAQVTPNGYKLCYAFNSASEGCASSCEFMHACRLCFGQHPMHQCGRGMIPTGFQ